MQSGEGTYAHFGPYIKNVMVVVMVMTTLLKRGNMTSQ